jgi:hypothetical protein
MKGVQMAIFNRNDERIARLFGTFLIAEAIACVFFAFAHLNPHIPLGFATLQEPLNIPAAIVETLCGIALTIGAVALIARHPRAWLRALGGQLFTLGGFILGIIAVARGGGGGDDPVNNVFHRVMLVLGLLGSYAMLRRGRRDTHPIEHGAA